MTPLSAVETAKMLRAELKAYSPATKFTVRKRPGASSTSLDIKWIDGPFEADVENIISPFQGSPDYLVTAISTERYFSGETYENIYAQLAERNPDLPILRDGYPNKHLPLEDILNMDTGEYSINGAVSIHEAAYQIALQHHNPKELVFS